MEATPQRPIVPATAESTIDARADDLIAEFSLFDGWMGRYEHLIDLGREIPEIAEAYKNDAHRIKGCQSKVWVRAEPGENGRLRLTGDSNAAITRGLVALLIRVLDDQPPEAVVTVELGFLGEIGMDEHLSPTRKNGLHAMVRQIKERAAALA